MEITLEQGEQMETIIAGMRTGRVPCQKDFECYSSSLEQLCRVKGIGAFDTIECSSENARCCGFSFAALQTRYCKCPLRRYIAANFHR